MRKYRSALWKPVMGISVFICLVLILSPGSVLAAHKLEGSQCFDCHVVGGSFDDVLDQSRLIKKDAKVSEILADAVWITGTPLPCAYCHDDTPYSVRENMIGVKDHFTGASLSSHPVNPYASNVGGVGDGGDGPNNLDCVDCHTLAAVSYVGQGASPGTTLSPNIHNQNTGAVAWTPAPGLLVAADTLEGGSPLNSLNNVFCTSRCHDVGQSSDFSSGQVLHSFSGTLVTIEHESGGSALSPAGCLSEGTYPDGCHGVHNVAENTDLIAIKKNASSYYGTGYVQRDECGICHIFDDPLRSTSDWIVNGHGRFETTNGIECTSCHDASIPHFQADGSPATGSSEGRLNFVLDTSQSGFSSPSKSLTSICSTCHAGKNPHSASDVGCLDCHDPHGYLVNGNNAMVRRTPPVASPASSLYYANQGDWYNSTSPPSSGNYSNYVCDQEDCHGGTGPGPIVDLMGGTHPGSYVSGCDTCHAHDNPRSFEARCDQCHGANESYWPAGGGDDGGTSPDNAGRHDIHRQKLEAELSYSPATTNDAEQRAMCQYCHDIGDSDHGSSTKAEVFASGGTALWGAPDANASHDSVTRVCSNVDCHNSKSTSSPYTWYETTSGTCTMCHTADASSPNVNAIADPTTGLHDVTPTVSGVQHDDNFSYSGSTADCTTCHTSTPSSSHLNGTANLSYPAVNLEATTIGFTDGTPPTCAPSLTGCHLEQDVSESWSRLWHDSSDLQDGSECAGCHGDFGNGWVSGVMHAPISTRGNSTHTNTADLIYPCTDCHGIGATTGNYAFASSDNDWDQNAGETSNHGDALISVNINNTGWTRANTRSGCNQCHEGADEVPAHDFPQTSWTVDTIQGDVPPVGCDGCHGDGAGQYWPDGSNGTPAYVDDNPNGALRHDNHILVVGSYLGYGSVISNYDDTQQQAACAYCHTDPGGIGHSTNNISDVGGSGRVNVYHSTDGSVLFRKFTGAAADTVDGSAGDYDYTNRSCASLVCHNRQTTPTAGADNWDGTSSADCGTCHINDPAENTNEGHAEHTSTQGYACTQCHANNGTNYSHQNGQVGITFTGGLEGSAGGNNGTYSEGMNISNISYRGGTWGTCSNVYCHNDKITPAWNLTIAANGCTDCHTPGGAGNDPISGLHESSYPATVEAHDDNFASGFKGSNADCTTCHTTTPSTEHINGNFAASAPTIAVATSVNFTDGSTPSCGPNTGDYATGCHTDQGNWLRQWSTSADSTTTTAGAARCNVCHGQWSDLGSGDGWRSGTSHYAKTSTSTNLDGRTVHDSSGNCDVCHAYVTVNNYHEEDANSGNLTMNSEANVTAQGGSYYCAGGGTACHDSGDANFSDRLFPASNAFDPFETVAGPTISAGGEPGSACKGCHNATTTIRRDISAEFGTGASTNAAHVGTWGVITNPDCEKCHYAGHTGDVTLWNSAVSNHTGSSSEYFSFARTADNPNVVNELCLSCHRSTSGYGSLSAPPSPDNGATNWQTADEFSVGSLSAVDSSTRWADASTTMYSKYDPNDYNVVPQIEKVYSPHRYPTDNITKGGTHSYTNTNHVACIECHTSHGSSFKSGQIGDSPWNSYNTDSGASGGVMLTAENSNNQQGTLYDGTGNPTYTSEAQLCWSCHPDGMDYRGDDNNAAAADTVEWQGTWDNSPHTFKAGGFRSSHFYPNRDSMAESWTTTPTGALRTNLTCSTCHDPHGVPTGGTLRDYKVPILRGTWLTSPYLEDAAPTGVQPVTAHWEWRSDGANMNPTDIGDLTPATLPNEVSGARFHPDFALNRPNTVGWGYADETGNTGVPGYYIDDNTFGVYGGNSNTSTGQMAGMWGSGNATTAYAPGNPADRVPVFVKHMDSYATSPGSGYQGQSSSVTDYTGSITNMSVGANSTANRIAGLCEKCHLFDDTTNAGDLGNYRGHITVVGLTGRSVYNVSWTQMFFRPYMHMKLRYRFADQQPGDGSVCDWGDPAQRASWHDGECGYHWGADPDADLRYDSGNYANPYVGYHKFSCSKCHTAHASRLPRLMATNCLDVGNSESVGETSSGTLKHNSSYAYPWVDTASTGGDSNSNFFERYWSSQAASGNVEGEDIAITCHANDDGSTIFSDGFTNFWNSVTPWP